MKIRVWCETGFVGADHEDEIEVPDDSTDAEIEDISRDMVDNWISWGWQRVEES